MRRLWLLSAVLLAAACASRLAYTPNPPAENGRSLPATAVLLFDDATSADPIRRYGDGLFMANLARKSDAGLPRLTAETVTRLLVEDFAASGAFESIRLVKRVERDSKDRLLLQGSLEKAVYHRRRDGTELTLTVLLRAISLPDGRIRWEHRVSSQLQDPSSMKPETLAVRALQGLFHRALEGLRQAVR